ncbi:hypothetical protein [Chryseolinea lacunae]|uniref:Uncharacterized protein n=1 Tax=Chryseolinea lacunae TaxID=2801331 RepID=A0ABS1L0H2_9BACT|nr:hypothetical protein [Chryseolinea lacunae]MBL0745085.1 hypothetical protein [Chryseolinea lacunae]
MKTEIMCKLYNGKISLGLFDGTSYNGGVYTGRQATTRIAEDGSLLITYQRMNGQILTVDGIRSLFGGHEYYAHGILGLVHPNDNEEIDRIESAYPY